MIFCVFNILLSQNDSVNASFKSENLVIMQVLTASSFWPEIVKLSVHCTLYRDTMHHILCYETQTTFSLLLCFRVFVLETMKTSSIIGKCLNKSFQTLYTFLGGSKYVPSELYSMERCNTCLTIRKLLVLVPS